MKAARLRGGLHPPDNKERTKDLPVERLSPSGTLVVPMSQHMGAVCEPAVAKGEAVRLGQLVGRVSGFVSAPVHSSVSGEVAAVEKRPHPVLGECLAVVIASDGKDTPDDSLAPMEGWERRSQEELRGRVRDAGLVGMGGAAFPTHVKVSPPADKPVDTFILNGAECEPYLTCDARLMVERPAEILLGARVLARAAGAKRVVVGVEDNKPEALSALSGAAEKAGGNIEVVSVHTRYPQGGEKQFIWALTGREVPSGGLPMDVGCLVDNVATALAAKEAVVDGKPLYERVVTVTGPGVPSPKNLLARIGTPITALLSACGLSEPKSRVIAGGPMTGIALRRLDVPVLKATGGVLVLEGGPAWREQPCIRCSSCVRVCPTNLVPTAISRAASLGRFDEAERLSALDCIECGCCAYICPAEIPLVHYIRLAKAEITAKRRAVKK